MVIPRGDLPCWRFIELLKLQISNYKYQMVRQAHHPEQSRRTISNDRNSKIQTMSRHGMFWSLNIGISDLFAIWCLEFVILDTKLQGRAIYP